jgi:hypothetical protein
MSKAHQAPKSHRPRYRYVAEHAIERLRERIRILDIDHRFDSDLVHWIDHAVEHAIKRGDVKVFDDRGDFARLVDITSDLDAPTFAVVKSNTRSDSNFGEAIVTVLDETMVDRYKEERWKEPGLMATKLAGVTIGRTNGNKKPEKSEAPVAESPPHPNEVILIEYTRGDQEIFEKIKRSELGKRLLEIALAGDDASAVTFWRRTKAQAKLDVIIEGI